MPQATPERAARWPGLDQEAIQFLQRAGFKLGRDWHWRHPADIPWRSRKLSEREADAIIYLQEEWDFGSYVRADLPESS